MSINLQKYNDNRAISGYGSALLYKDSSAGDTKYHLLIPLETVPSVSGSADSFEFDLLTSTSKGKIAGKESLDEKDVEFLWHRDNVKRLEDLQGKTLDFLAVYADMTGRKFSGTIQVRPNDASNDVFRGTFTITPTSAETTTILDVSEEIQDTVTFTSAIPSRITIKKSETKEMTIGTNPSTATLVATSSNTNITASCMSSTLTISSSSSTATTGVVEVKASASGMASWTTYILVEVTA